MKTKIAPCLLAVLLTLLLLASCYNPWMADILEKRTISFDSNGGSYVSSQSMYKGKRAERPANPAKPGNSFAGWYQDNGAWNYEWDFNAIPQSDLTLYAKWDAGNHEPEPTTCTVTFDADGGSNPATQTVTEGEKATKPADPAKGGFTFVHWFNTATDTEWDFNTPITANITLKARWTTKPTYTVSFDADGGSDPTTQTVIEGEKATKPADPAKDGYTLDHWFNTATNLEWDFNAPVTANITLKAKWNINQYTVTFNANSGTPAPTQQTINYNGTVSEPPFMTRTGYTFGGWYKEAALTNQWNFTTDTVTGTTTLYAKWNATVTFNANGATSGSAPAEQIVPAGSSITLPNGSGLTKTDSTFGGWNTSADGTGNNYAVGSSYPVTSNTTLYAKWNINQYAVNFNADSGTPAPSQQTVDHGGTVTQPAAMTKANHTFGGWFRETTFTNEWVFAADTVTGATTLYAKWNINTYTVTFSVDGGSEVAAIPNVSHGTTIAAPTAPTKANHTFGGWYKEAALSNEWVFATDTVTANIILYAKWNINTYTVTFNSNDGSEVAAITNVGHDTTITAPANPTKANHTFGGWYKEAALSNQWNFTTDTVTGATTLYAKWNLNTYTVSFNVDGGSAVAAIPNVSHGTTIAAPTAPTKANHTFGGWYKEAALSNEWVFATDTVTGATNLYAKWTANSAGITITVSQIEDEAFEFPDNITISRTNAGGTPVTYPVTVENPTGYSSIAWEVAGVGAGMDVTGLGASFTLDAANVNYNSLGGHVLILTITKNGLQYRKAIPFTIVQ